MSILTKITMMDAIIWLIDFFFSVLPHFGFLLLLFHICEEIPSLFGAAWVPLIRKLYFTAFAISYKIYASLWRTQLFFKRIFGRIVL